MNVARTRAAAASRPSFADREPPRSACCHIVLMTTKSTIGLLLSACCAVAIGACGDDQESGSAATPTATQTAAPSGSSSSGENCMDVMVPGHKAIDVKTTGAECATAEKIAAAAEGRGRAAYESGGFACKPTDASGGDTNYRCSMGSATITFLYGTT